MAKKGRPPASPEKDLIVYLCVESARKIKRPKHPGLEPIFLSWEKAYVEACRVLNREWRFNFDPGGVRHAYARGKKVFDKADSFRIRGFRYTRKKAC